MKINFIEQTFTDWQNNHQSLSLFNMKKNCATLFGYNRFQTLSSFTLRLLSSLIILLRIIFIKSFFLLSNWINVGGKNNAKNFQPVSLMLPNWCWTLLILFLATGILKSNLVLGQYDWQKPDSFDEIRQKLDSLTMDNCKVLDVNRLFLPHSTVTHVPNLQWLGIDPIFPNRTNLLHVHNMALSRAFFLRSVIIIIYN